MSCHHETPSMGNNEKGMTLIEALAAATLLSIFVIMFMTISSYSILANNKSNYSFDAYQIAEEHLHLARDYVRQHNALPANPTVPGYSVMIQTTELEHNPSGYDKAQFGLHHVSLQSIVLIHLNPVVMTVTVSWSD